MEQINTIFTGQNIVCVPPPHAISATLKSNPEHVNLNGVKHNELWHFYISNPLNTKRIKRYSMYIDWTLENGNVISEYINQIYFAPTSQLPEPIKIFELNTLKVYNWQSYTHNAHIDLYIEGDDNSILFINNSPFKQTLTINGETITLPPILKYEIDDTTNQLTLGADISLEQSLNVDWSLYGDWTIDLNGHELYIDLNNMNSSFKFLNGTLKLNFITDLPSIELININLLLDELYFQPDNQYILDRCTIKSGILHFNGHCHFSGNKFFSNDFIHDFQTINAYNIDNIPFYDIMVNTFAKVYPLN